MNKKEKAKQINFSCYPALMKLVNDATIKTDTRIDHRLSKSLYIRRAIIEKLKKDGFNVSEFEGK